MKILEIKNLSTIAEDDHNKEILKGLNLEINPGEVHVIMGPNGSGKSTLANTIFASPRYIITDGNIKLCDEDITNLSTDKIAKKGVFMSFQTPEEIPGVSLAQFLKTTKHSITGEKPNLYKFTKEVESYMNEDETDSGLDVDAIKTVSKGINLYKNDQNAVLIITHSTKILESLKVDKVHVLVDGKIVKTGDSSLAREIEDNGYSEFIK